MLSILEIVLRGNSRPSYASIAMTKKPRTKSSTEKTARESIKTTAQLYRRNMPKKADVKMVGTRKFKGITRK